jgi:hypothetical protein
MLLKPLRKIKIKRTKGAREAAAAAAEEEINLLKSLSK